MDTALSQAGESGLSREVSDWQSLHSLSSRLLQATSLADQLQAVLQTVAHFHNSQQGVISLFNSRAGGLVTAASLGVSEEGLKQLACVAIGDGACGLAFKEKRRVIVRDTETDAIYAAYRAFAREQGFRGVFSTPFFGAGGETLGVLSIYSTCPRHPDERELRLTDICVGNVALLVERERAERKLRREQECSHQILSSIKEGFMFLDTEFRILQINAEGLRLDGRPASDILGRTLWEVWAGSEQLPVGEACKRAIQERVAVSLEQCYWHFGQDVWLDIQAYPSGDGLAMFYRDIRARKHAEMALRDSEQRMRRLFEANPIGVSYGDTSGNILDANPAYLRLIEATREELAHGAIRWDKLTPPEFLPRDLEAIREVAESGVSKIYEKEYQLKSGKRLPVLVACADFGGNGQLVAFVVDISARKQAECALRDADHRKDRFLATLAHELRNPLAPVMTASTLLSAPNLPPEKITWAAEVIQRQVNHMKWLLDDLLDVSRITLGKLQLKQQIVLLSNVVDAAVETARPLVERKQHQLAINLPAEPIHLFGDPLRLSQVLSNLLMNAAKYTAPGGLIQLRAGVEDGHLRVAVKDNGIGIASSALGEIFTMFAQIQDTVGQAEGGLGIGLALCKGLVELHGGVVEAHSEGVGQGSEFVVTLPLPVAPPSHLAGKGAMPANQPSRRVLIVDDNEDAANMLAALTSMNGHEVRTAHNGRTALALAESFLPEILVLDIGMPDLNGYDVAQALRQHSWAQDIYLVALTGWGQEDDKRRTHQAGFDVHLTKPVDSQQFLALLHTPLSVLRNRPRN